MKDPYIYPDSDVLKNLADIRDVFEWAGRPRVINIEKAEVVLGEISIEYSDCMNIVTDARQILKEMNQFNWQEATFDEVIKAFGNFIAKLWKVHPYREGNTRTIVTFCSMFIEAQSIYVESDLFKDNAAYMRDALVAANAIFGDLGDLRKPEYLHRILQDALEQGMNMKEQVAEQIRGAGLSVTQKRIRKVVFWNRKEKREHTSEEIKIYLT